MARLPLVTICIGVAMTLVGVVGFAAGWGSEPADRATSPSADAATTSVATSTTAAPETASAFLAAYVAALRSGDSTFLVDRLATAVVDRYGRDQCAAFVAQLADPQATLTLTSVSGPAPFEYTSDGLSRAVPATYTFAVDGTVQGRVGARDYHFALVDGRYRTFVDCGTPVSGAS